MSGFAGAALAMPQNTGRLCCWGSWAVTQKTCGWLLISGDCNPPASVEVSKRKERAERSGSYLSGINYDVQNMEQTIEKEKQFELVQRRSQLKIDVADCKAELQRLARVCADKGWKPCIYYTGHGECGTGDWCFGDGKLSLSELLSHFQGDMPMVISDCCFSGVWANDCNGMRLDGFYVLSACCEFECAIDHTNKGGSLTLWTTGAVTRKKCPNHHDLTYYVRSKSGSNNCDGCGRQCITPPEHIFRCESCDHDLCKDCCSGAPKVDGKFPATCPLWSGSSYDNYKLPNAYSDIKFTEFLSSQLKGKWSGHTVHAMSVTLRGKLTVLLGKVTPCPGQMFGDRPGVDSLTAYVKEGWDAGYHIKHLQGFGGGDTRFYVHMEKGYGSNGQNWFGANTNDDLTSKIKKKWDEGCRITSCFADGTFIYCVNTKDVPDYHGKAQGWFLKNKWSEVRDVLREKYKDGQILTGLTYLEKTKQYFGVTTESTKGQSYTWQEGAELAQWQDDHQGFKRTVVFTDPTDGKTLTCITSGYESARSYHSWSIDTAR